MSVFFFVQCLLFFPWLAQLYLYSNIVCVFYYCLGSVFCIYIVATPLICFYHPCFYRIIVDIFAYLQQIIIIDNQLAFKSILKQVTTSFIGIIKIIPIAYIDAFY